MNALELVRRFGSPAYAYELARVREAHSALVAALPQPADLFYSLKANPHPAVASELARLRCHAEVSSIGELRTALQAGFAPSSCLYTGPGKTAAELAQALRLGCRRFSVDSPWDLAKVSTASAAARARSDVLLRINPDSSVPGMGLTMCGTPSQFGADAAWVLRQPDAFRGNASVDVVGFHFYMGTNLSAPDAVCRAIGVALDTARELMGRGFAAKILDLGGGFGHPFAVPSRRPDFSALRAPVESILDRLFPGWRLRSPAVMFESGRYLVASAGRLFATVQDVKISKGRTFIVLDAGINHLGGMAGLRRLPNVGVQLKPHVTDETTDMADADLVGPLCTPLDALARGTTLPKLRVGDVVEIPNVGAYGLTASLMAFLSHAAPEEIVLDVGKIVEASRLVLCRSPSYQGGLHDARTNIRAASPAAS
jgi:diaminopimelate decarboxylase